MRQKVFQLWLHSHENTNYGDRFRYAKGLHLKFLCNPSSNGQLELELKETGERRCHKQAFPQLAWVWCMTIPTGIFMNKERNKPPQDFKLHGRVYLKLLSIKWPLKNEIIMKIICMLRANTILQSKVQLWKRCIISWLMSHAQYSSTLCQSLGTIWTINQIKEKKP